MCKREHIYEQKHSFLRVVSSSIKMEIDIVGFKCYKSASFKFVESGLVLLKGCSGAGKSTILQAIMWCLFGKIRSVDRNIGSKKGKLSVTIKITLGGKMVEIYRQKRPSVLKISVDGNEQVDDVAQAQINELFGSHDICKLCCYLEQNQTNHLFRVSSSEKMSLLGRIAFNESDPTPYIQRIEEQLKEEKVRFQVLQDTFKRECDDFAEFIKSQDIDPKDGKTEDEMSELFELKVSLEKEISSLRVKSVKHHESVSAVKILDERINSYKTSLDQYGDKDFDEEITRLNPIVDSLMELKHSTTKVQQLESELKECESKLLRYEGIEECTELELYKSNNNFDLYSSNLKKAEMCGVDYDKDSIEHKKEFVRCSLKIQPSLKVHKNMMDVYEKISKIEVYEVDEDTIRTQENRISEIKRASEVMECPKCGQHLLHIHKSLEVCECVDNVKSDKELDTEERKLDELKEQLKSNKERSALIEQFNKLKDMYTEEIGTITKDELKVLGEHSSKRLESSLISEYEKIIPILHSIEHIEKPTEDVEILKLGVQKSKLLDERTTIKSKHDECLVVNERHKKECGEHTVDDLEELREKMQNAKTCRSLRKSLLNQIDECTKERDLHIPHIDESISETLDQCEEKIREVLNFIEKARVTNEAVRRQKSLKDQREEIVETSKCIVHLERLKGIAVEVECKVLQQTVNSINSTVNILSENIFDDPIGIELKLHKKLKTKKIIKPGVNLEIRYKGGVYDNPNDVSGGEQDRLSLLIMLAMNRMSGSPVIMLDETFSSLDESIKEHCLRALRSAAPDKLVLCVDHGGVEGHYDQVIQIGPD